MTIISCFQAQLLESIKSTWSTFSEFAKSHFSSSTLEGAVEKAVEEVSGPAGVGGSTSVPFGSVTSEISSTQTEEDVDMGAINGGRRVDYVLQVRLLRLVQRYRDSGSFYVIVQ